MSLIEKGSTFLVVDDDAIFRNRLCLALKDRGYESFSAASCASAIAMTKEHAPEFALIDLKIEHESGLTLLKSLLYLEPLMKIVMLTGYGSVTTALEAVKLGAIWYLQKPADLNEILLAFYKSQDKGNAHVMISTPSLARLEWDHIDRVLNDVRGNISEAARRLGLHRRSLHRKLQKRPPKL